MGHDQVSVRGGRWGRLEDEGRDEGVDEAVVGRVEGRVAEGEDSSDVVM